MRLPVCLSVCLFLFCVAASEEAPLPTRDAEEEREQEQEEWGEEWGEEGENPEEAKGRHLCSATPTTCLPLLAAIWGSFFGASQWRRREIRRRERAEAVVESLPLPMELARRFRAKQRVREGGGGEQEEEEDMRGRRGRRERRRAG